MSDYVMDCGELDRPTLWDARKIKARKTHKCYECGHPIVVGEEHHYFKCLFEGTWDSWRTCVCCEAARCAVAEAYSEGSFPACVLPGELWSAVREGLREGWLKREAIGDLPRGFMADEDDAEEQP